MHLRSAAPKVVSDYQQKCHMSVTTYSPSRQRTENSPLRGRRLQSSSPGPREEVYQARARVTRTPAKHRHSGSGSFSPSDLGYQAHYTFIGSAGDGGNPTVSVFWHAEMELFRALKKERLPNPHRSIPASLRAATPIDEDKKPRGMKFYYSEVAANRVQNHPSIVRQIDHRPVDIQKNMPGQIEFEYVPGCNLDELVSAMKQHRTPRGMDDVQVFIIVLGLARALKYLHKLNIGHLDLKPDNVLISRYLEPMLCNYGVPRNEWSERQQYSIPCTEEYAAPEILAGRPFSLKADVYSFGKVVTEFLNLGERNRPVNRTSIYSPILEACLIENPNDRADMKWVVHALKELISRFEEVFRIEQYLEATAVPVHDPARQFVRGEEGTMDNMRNAANRGLPKAQALYGACCDRFRSIFHTRETPSQGAVLTALGKLCLKVDYRVRALNSPSDK